MIYCFIIKVITFLRPAVFLSIKGLIGSLHQPLGRLTGCSLSLFGYLHEVASLAPAVQKVPTSLAPEERGNRSHAVSLAVVMQE